MLRTCLDAAGDLVDADMADFDGTYFCPRCRGETVLRHVNRGPYFAHVDGHCPVRNHGKSDWHAGWQAAFGESNTEITSWSGGMSRRADVMLGNLVLEFQHSSISDSDWTERTRFYMEHMEKMPLWVYDRHGRDFQSDLDGLGRAFGRSAELVGPDWAVAADYDGRVVLSWDLEPWDGRLFRPSRTLELTRAGFLELARTLSAYPYDLLIDLDFGDLRVGGDGAHEGL